MFPTMLERTRELRRHQTPAVKVMWKLRRNRRFMHLRFRRQHQIGSFIVDFLCAEARLISEHESPAQARYDAARDAYLQSLGFRVLRFSAEAFLADPARTLRVTAQQIPHHGG